MKYDAIGVNVRVRDNCTDFKFRDLVPEYARTAHEQLLRLAYGMTGETRFEWLDYKTARMTVPRELASYADRILGVVKRAPLPAAIDGLAQAIREAPCYGAPPACVERLRIEWAALIGAPDAFQLPPMGRA